MQTKWRLNVNIFRIKTEIQCVPLSTVHYLRQRRREILWGLGHIFLRGPDVIYLPINYNIEV